MEGIQMVEEGQKAPDFTLPTGTGETMSLADFRGKPVVLYFYPRDNTPGCTKEACGFRDLHEAFSEVGAVILGVSTDSPSSHKKFAEKYQLPFPLLSDEDAAVSTAYGVYKEKTRYGKKSMGIERTTFLIDGDGVIRKIYPRVKVEGHMEQVLEDVRHLSNG
ncbi:peroxiredoxin with versatile activity [Kyrpidia spormannii]|uniref:Peroxiredoxin with versatile activity n=3 Tax=Kyrpidia spormannii TaxID=2055160 RepID=A0ACA8ZAW4_9BACL|nr:peroxiredoxin with versatile activity [Kyrpidia spormannii]CAB3394789.1 peroxiredoxin with versatile activity [Kyrpidia spormannii]